MSESKCPRCRQVISSDDTLYFDGKQVFHLNCGRPRQLSYEERVLLFRYCFGHAVAKCLACGASFRQHQLGVDRLGRRTQFCPRGCRVELTASVRTHLYGCAMLPDVVRYRARELREVSRKLLKHTQQLGDRSDVLMREIDAGFTAPAEVIKEYGVALAALREAMRQVTDAQFGVMRK